MIKRAILAVLLCLLWPVFSHAQGGAPAALYPYVGKGDTVTVVGGKVFTTNGSFTISRTDITPTVNGSTYVYLDLSQNPPVVAQSASAYPASNYYPICTITTSGARITSFSDDRPDSFMAAGNGNGTTTIVSSGLMADYQIQEGSGTTIADATGQQSAGTFGANVPTWGGTNCLGVTDCLSFQTNQTVVMPSALNTARTIQLVMNMQQSVIGASDANVCPIVGNGTTAIGICYWPTNGAGLRSLGSWVMVRAFNKLISSSGNNTTENGLFVMTFVCPSSGTALYYANTAASTQLGVTNMGTCTLPSDGTWLLGGSGSTGAGVNLGSFYGGIFRALFYNRALTTAEIYSNVAALQAWTKSNDGVIPTLINKDTTPLYLEIGTSISNGNLGKPFSQSVTLNSLNGQAFTTNLIGISGLSASQAVTGIGTTSFDNVPLYHMANTVVHPSASANVIQLELGTNDLCSSGTPANNVNSTFTSVSSAANALKSQGYTVFISTMLARTPLAGCDAARDTLNNLFLTHYREFSSGIVNFASDPLIGADGAASSSTWYNADTIHPLAVSEQNFMAHMSQLVINRYLGNKNFAVGNVYTSTASAGIATTAGSESGSTTTITVAAGAPAAGTCVQIAGVTPAGYNSPAGHCWQVLTSNGSTSFTYTNSASGLGAITVNGTITWPQDADADTYATLGACVGCTHTLQSCMGQMEPIYRLITSANAWTITPFASETINGAATFTTPTAAAGNNPIVKLTPALNALATSGCNWTASLQ